MQFSDLVGILCNCTKFVSLVLEWEQKKTFSGNETKRRKSSFPLIPLRSKWVSLEEHLIIVELAFYFFVIAVFSFKFSLLSFIFTVLDIAPVVISCAIVIFVSAFFRKPRRFLTFINYMLNQRTTKCVCFNAQEVETGTEKMRFWYQEFRMKQQQRGER